MTDSTKTTVTRFRVITNPNPPRTAVVVGREITRTRETSVATAVDNSGKGGKETQFVTGSPGHYHGNAIDAAAVVTPRRRFGVVAPGSAEERAAATGSGRTVVGAPSLSVVRLSEELESAARALAEQIIKNHIALCRTPSGIAHKPMHVTFYEPDTDIVYMRAVQILALEYNCQVANYARQGHGLSQVQVDPSFHLDPDYCDVGC